MGQAEGEEVRRGQRYVKSKHRWYVSCELKEKAGKRGQSRLTETFRNEQDAKAFARAKLADGLNVNAGTLNPHAPKRTITSKQLVDWLDQPDETADDGGR
jgi:hypothetical protein